MAGPVGTPVGFDRQADWPTNWPSGIPGVAMTTRLTHAELLAAHRACGNAEYDALISAPPDRMCGIALSMGGEVGPPVHCFLAALQKAGLGAS